ncbi:MAG: hypothetical protein ACOC1G_02070 [Phycisphaeraceae bacterium]
MKLALRILAVVVVLIVLAAVAGWIFADQIAASTIRKSSSYATGTENELRSADLKLTSGELNFAELVITNPEGYESAHFLTLGNGDIDVKLGTITRETIEVPLVVLSNLDVILEKREGKANYEAILENLEKLGGDEEPEEQPDDAGAGVVIEELRIEQISVTIKGYPFPSEPVVIDEPIVLKNVPQDQSAATIAEVVGLVITATLQTVAGSVGDLPGELTDGITDGLGKLGDLGSDALGDLSATAGEAAKQAGEKAKEATDKAGEEAGGAADKAKEEVDKATGKIGDLLGGNDEEQDSDEDDDSN